MLKFAANIPEDVEVAIVGHGQSNCRPWGHRDREGFVEAEHLALRPAGQDLTIQQIIALGTSHGAVGEQSLITIAESVGLQDAVNATIRLVHVEFGDAVTGTERSGSAKIVQSIGEQLVVEWLTPLELDSAATVTFSDNGGALQVNWNSHGQNNGDPVRFWTDDELPTGLSRKKTYVIANATPNAFDLEVEVGGGVIPWADAGTGTHTVSLAGSPVVHQAGYLTHNDRWKSYANVRVLTPYQPEVPGDYPPGPPEVPGYDFPKEVESYEDTGLFLDFSWEEGVEGIGTTGDGTGVTVTADSMTVVGANWKVGVFDGAEVRCGNARATIGENSKGKLTDLEWVPAMPTGTLDFEIHVPHYRDNPRRNNPGKGFRYPSNDMMPGGGFITSPGTTYNRPSGVLTRSYSAREYLPATVSATVNSTGNAQSKDTDGSWLVASLSSGKLRITTSGNTPSNAASGEIQFEDFLRVGHVVKLGNWSGTVSSADPNRDFRVTAMSPSGAGASWVELEELNGSAITEVSATSAVGANVARWSYRPAHRFGAMIEAAWRLSSMIGRRVNVIHLGINSSAQFLRRTNNAFAFQGKIGWWDDDKFLDWTPGNPNGNAARLKRMITKIAPAALLAEGSTKKLQVFGVYGLQGEAEAIEEAGRELYHRSLPAFYRWLRRTIYDAGLSAYDEPFDLPFCHAKLPTVPWELDGVFYGLTLTGDKQGLVNKAITQLAARDPFGSTIETEEHEKLDGTTLFLTDPLHFNGVGEAKNGKAIAEALSVQINSALSQQDRTGALDVCNMALKHLGQSVRIEDFDEDTPEADACRMFFEISRDAMMESHNWSAAQKHRALEAVENTRTDWNFAYAVPANVARVRAVVPPDQIGDMEHVNPDDHPFVVEQDDDGYEVIYSNADQAQLLYTRYLSDVTLMSDLFRLAWSWMLAELLAGPVVGGDEGSKRGAQAKKMAEYYLVRAREADSRHRRVRIDHKARHLRAR